MPVAVLLDPEQLLHLNVRDAELDVLRLVAAGDACAARAADRRAHDEEVAKDDSSDVMIVAGAAFDLDGPVADHVDVVAFLERAGEKLIRVTGKLVGPLSALDLSPDALLRGRSEASRAHLLALEHVLDGDVLCKLVGRRDRARNDCLAGHGLLLEHLLVDYVRA